MSCGRLLAVGIASLVGFIGWQVDSSAGDLRNVVLILADDLGCRDLSCEGSRYHRTPNIDRIASDGVRFTQGYAACQVCSPSRASLMTGKAPVRHGITNYIGAASGLDWKRNTILRPPHYQRQLASEELTLAEAVRDHGYATFFAGKWHLGGEGSLPTDHGFEVNRGGNGSGTPRGGFFAPFRNPQLDDRQPGESLPRRLGRETAQFIREQHRNDPDQPFLAYLAFYSVHAPIQTTKPLWTKYRQVAESFSPPERRFVIDRTLPVRQVQDNPIYAGMMEAMDSAVGDVLEALDTTGLTDETLIIFTSDNGGVSSGDAYATSNLPFRGGKGRQWEGGIREPFLIAAPGVATPGSTNETPVIGMDVYPTVLDLLGLPARPEQHVDGVSLAPLLRGQTIAERSLFWFYPHYGNQGGEPSAIIRRGDWKLIHYFEDGHDELYNLADDPSEQVDRLADDADLGQDLREALDAYLTATQAEIPQRDPRYVPEAAARSQGEIRQKLLPRLERNHARYLDPDWQPNPTWWGSQPKP